MKSILLTLSVMLCSLAGYGQVPGSISGPSGLCGTTTASYFDTPSGGTWSSSDTAIATINSSTGLLTTVSYGAVTISYTTIGGTATASVVINPLPSAISSPSSICLGGTATATDAAPGGAWSSSFPGIVNIGITGIMSGLSVGTAAISYTLPSGCLVTRLVTVNPGPAIFSVAGGGYYCAGGAGLHISLSSSQTGVTYQLYNGATPVSTALSGTGSALDWGPYTTTGTYTVTAYNVATGCTSTMSGSAVIGTNPLPSVYMNTGGGAYCAGSGGVHISLSGSDLGILYQLFKAGAPVGSLSGTGSPLDFGLLAAPGMYTISGTNTSTGCTAMMSGVDTITVNAAPVSFNVTGGGSFCSGGTGVHVGLNGSNYGINYQLYNGASAIGGPVAGIGTGIDFGFQSVAGSYSVVAVNAMTGCAATMYGTAIVSLLSSPGAITGYGSICPDATLSLADITAGGTWSSSNPAQATVSVSGVLTGVATGTPVISYTLASGCYATATVTVNVAPGPIIGLSSVCAGSTIGESDAIAGGLWSSSNTAVAVIGSSGVTGVTAGASTITYSLGSGCSVTKAISVNPLPSPLIGPSTLCAGGAFTFSGSLSGGYWSSSNTAAATIDNISGSGSAVAPGSSVITYTMSTGCSTTHTLSVVLAPAPITGAGTVCTGNSVSLGEAVSGGTWSTSNPAVATVGVITGMVTGTGSGIATVTYSLGTGCAATHILTVNGAPASVTGPDHVCSGSLITLTDGTPGGSWSCGTPVNASINPTTGVLTGLSAGSSMITYTLVSGCAITTMVTVNAIPAPPGGTGAICAGNNTYVTDSTSGGFWSSSNTAVAIIGASSGLLIAGAPGTTSISYTLPTGCAIAATETVNPVPSAITGIFSFCTGAMSLLSDPSAGGTWSSNNPGIATVAPTGSVSGVNAGTAVISYSVSGCSVARAVTVNPLPAVYTVTGGGSFCSGSSGPAISLSSSDYGVHYQVYNGGAPVGTYISGTGSSLPLGYFTTGSYTVVAGNPATGCIANMSGSATVTPYPSPTAFAVTGGGAYCFGGAGANISLAGSQTGITYQLYNGIMMGSALSGTGSPLDFGNQTNAGTYTVTATDPVSGCVKLMTGSALVSINPLPTAFTVTGGGSYCAGGTGVHITLSSSGASIQYQLYNGLSSVGSAVPGTGGPLDFGLVTPGGIYSVIGTNMVTGCTNNMAGSATVNINPLPDPVTGSSTGCAGNIVPLSDVSSGGVWNSATPSLATVDALTGIVNCVATGTADIHYALPTGCGVSFSLSINPTVPASVNIVSSAGDTVCGGTDVLFSAIGTGGGTSPAYAWKVNGLSAGTGPSYSYTPANGDVVDLYMTSSAACASPAVSGNTVHMIVFPTPTPIYGGTALCIGSTLPLSDGVTGGTWTERTGAAIVGTVGSSTGVATAVFPGIDTIVYTLDGGCYASMAITVSAVPAVTLSSSLLCEGVYTLTASGAAAFVWSPAAGLSCTTCSSTNTDPLTTTTYNVTGTNPGGCSDTASITVSGNRIRGHISIGDTGVIKVWLIRFNAADSSIAALDSTFTCTGAGEPYFEFDNPATGNYMVKAFLTGGTPGTSGYIPTYSLSTPHWDSAATLLHTGNTDTMHINMRYGIIPPGPGFIGGFVSSGAGKGTSGIVPAQGMLVYLLDAATRQVLTYTYTDATGHYAFNAIGYGNYIVYPEEYQYATTPSAAIAINAGNETASGIDFRQHTMERTITPYAANGTPVLASNAGWQVYPNPASGNVFIQWHGQTTSKAEIVLTDITGREVLRSDLIMQSAAGQTRIDLSGINGGVYFITIRSSDLMYNGKLVIE